MIGYIAKRLLQLVPVLVIMSMIVFMFLHLVPGDPVDAVLGNEATEEAKAALRERLGLDQPMPVQYVLWAGRVLQGDLGHSIVNGTPVLDTIVQKMGVTIFLALGSVLVSAIIAIIGGTIAAARKGSWIDLGILSAALVGVSVPSFWLAILLMLCFAVQWHIFPSIGYTPPGENFADFLHHLVLPVVTLGAIMAGALSRLTRSEMIDQLNEDYILTARAKGVPERKIIYKHALRNALIPVITFAGMELGTVLGGAIIVERIFSLPGLGQLVVESIFLRDYPVVQGTILFLSIVFVLINLLVDISYTLLDPQIRMTGASVRD